MRSKRETLIRFTGFVLLVFLAVGCERDPESWTTASGLQITELVEGEGASPNQGDIVGVIYTGWYLDGKQFDTYQVTESPYRFRVGKGAVLPGLDEGISTMRKGGKRILIMPPELAFGPEERLGTVPPNAWVKFEVELLTIDPGPREPMPWNDAGLDIVDTPSGLQFVDFVVGSGESPTFECTVVVHYSGFLEDGTLFDSTMLGGVPLEFDLSAGQLIPGWLEGILSMRAGGQRKLIIPPHLGYGEKGFGKQIPPNATLIYDIQLVSFR